MKKQNFTVSGMSCAACSAKVENTVKKLPYVSQAEVNLLLGTLTVVYADSQSHDTEIMEAVEKIGYKAFLTEENRKENRHKKTLAGMKQRLIVSFVLLFGVVAVMLLHMFVPLSFSAMITLATIQMFLALAVIVVNYRLLYGGLLGFVRLSPNMNSLVLVGVLSAMLYSFYSLIVLVWQKDRSVHLYFDSAAMILTLVSLGKYLETRAKAKTGEAVEKLIALIPDTVRIEKDGKEETIFVKDLQVGDLVIARPGERIAADGMVTSGSTFLDCSAITGESMPVECEVGCEISAASVNLSGEMKYRAIRVGQDTALGKIVKLVEEAGATKAPVARLADKLAFVFVPIVMGIALITFAVWMFLGNGLESSLMSAVSVLLISCPCALGLATPAAIMAGIGVGAVHHVLIKDAASLEMLGKVDVVVLDKTGTVTLGIPQVIKIQAAESYTEQEILEIACSLEHSSMHPLALAVCEYCESQGIVRKTTEDFSETPGKGVAGNVDGKMYRVGNAAFANVSEENLIWSQKDIGKDGASTLYVAGPEGLLGYIALSDDIKEDSAQAVEEFQSLGIDVCMITGDAESAARSIAKKAGISHVRFGVLPSGKEAAVSEIQKSGKKVAMIGDGINDAPALSRADVGIAIGAGTDIAIDSADIVLASGSLRSAVTAVRLSRATMRNIKQNLFWALFYNCIGIPLAAGVLYPLTQWQLSPAVAAAAMSLSSLCVVTNALRLRRFRPYDKGEACTANTCALPKDKNDTPNIEKIQEKKTMSTMNQKTIEIEGMMCMHCTGSVQKALSAIPGVTVKDVSLENKCAYVETDGNVSEDVLKKTVTDMGYTVLRIS